MKRLMRVKGVFTALAAAALVGCLDVSGPGPSDPAKETFASSLKIGNLSDTSVWKRGPTGTWYRDDVVGTGPTLVVNSNQDTLYVDYTGWLTNVTSFDSATDAHLPACCLIIGFLDGIVDMRKGGTRTVVVPSNLAYGNSTRGSIPKNSTLVFRSKLITFSAAGVP